MIKTPSQSFISSNSYLQQSINSNVTKQSEVENNQLSQQKRWNNMEDSRRREQNKYQKKIQLYTQSIKKRVLPSNISETNSQVAAPSIKNSRVISNIDLITQTNSEIQDKNQSIFKYQVNVQDPNLNIASYPTILKSTGYKQNIIEQSMLSKKDDKLQTGERQSSQISIYDLSSREFTYRSNQSTHPTSGEHTNKYLSSKYLSVLSPVKSLSINQINNLSEMQVDKQQTQIKQDSFKNEMAQQPIYQPIETQFTYIKPSQQTIYMNNFNGIDPRQQIITKNEYMKVKTQPEQEKQNSYIEEISEIPLSEFDFKGSRGQSLKQSGITHNSMSFNINQPSYVYNDEICSKKNSINISNYLKLVSQSFETENQRGMNGSYYSYSTQNKEQKFMKTLIHKLHKINTKSQINHSNSDLMNEGSIYSQTIQQQYSPKSRFLTALEANNNIQSNSESLKNPPNNLNDPQNSSKKVRSSSITPIKNSYKNLSSIKNKNNKNYETSENPTNKQSQKITLIRNSSQQSLTSTKKLHQKSQSQTNLHNISLKSTQNSLKVNTDNKTQSSQQYEKDYNYVKQTEFSQVPPIGENSLSSVAQRKQKIKSSFSLPQKNVKQNSQNQYQNIESEVNTARLQQIQGWRCC